MKKLPIRTVDILYHFFKINFKRKFHNLPPNNFPLLQGLPSFAFWVPEHCPEDVP